MLVERDKVLLGFMCQWQFMLASQCAEYLGCSEQVARRRLREMRALGLLDVMVPFSDYRQVHWVNREGLRYVRGSVGVNAGRLGPKLSQFEHDRRLVDLAVRFHREHPEYEVHGEVEMRRVDGEALAKREPLRFATQRWSGGRMVNVFPDMVASKNGRKFVIEYEHTKKDPARLRSLMRAYATNPEVDAVKYYGSDAAFPQLERLYREMEGTLPLVGGKPKVQVARFEEGER